MSHLCTFLLIPPKLCRMWSISRPWMFRRNQIGFLQIYPLSSPAPSTPRFPFLVPKSHPTSNSPLSSVVSRSTLESTMRRPISIKYYLCGILVLIRTIIWTRPTRIFMSPSRLPCLHQKRSSRIDSMPVETRRAKDIIPSPSSAKASYVE
jgi:hypothetical protein